MRAEAVMGALALALLGCHSSHEGGVSDAGAGRAGDGGTTTPPPAGRSYAYRVTSIEVGAAELAGDPELVPGFDLDGIVGREDDPRGCYHPDYVAPPPDAIRGVDNQLGPLLDSVDASLYLSTTIAEWIDSGRLVIDIDVAGVSSLSSDPAVTVTVTIEGRSVELAGRIEGGRLIASGSRLVVPPLVEGGGDFSMADVQLRASPRETGLVLGVTGGSVDVEEMIHHLVALRPGEIPESLARSVLEAEADLSPDATGLCRRISLGFVFEARRR